MNGPIAQIIALCLYTKGYLKSEEKTKFLENNSTSQFCDKISFVTFKKPLFGKEFKEVEIANNPDDWFSYIKILNPVSIALFYSNKNDSTLSNRMSSAFVGGGNLWFIEVKLPNGLSDIWISKWDVWDQNAPDRKIWRVKYGLVEKRKDFQKPIIGLSEAKNLLTKSLEEILHFAKNHNCHGFAECFSKALDSVNSNGTNLHGYHKDLPPESVLSIEAIALLDACQSSWVFGGMGSWNDMYFKDDDQNIYERVSNNLFNSINISIEAAVNSPIVA